MIEPADIRKAICPPEPYKRVEDVDLRRPRRHVGHISAKIFKKSNRRNARKYTYGQEKCSSLRRADGLLARQIICSFTALPS